MEEQVCPECGCEIDEEACEVNGIVYCCEPCAVNDQCECGCCAEEDDDE